MDSFVIRDGAGGSLEFLGRELVDPQRRVEQLTVRLTAPGLSAEGTADVADFPDRLFADMTRQWWTGWAGELAWESLEGELALRCRQDRSGGHVRIEVALGVRLSGWEFTWQVRFVLVTEAGELGQLARDAEVFFSPAEA